jgi:malonyl-CoA O-methyltransferase
LSALSPDLDTRTARRRFARAARTYAGATRLEAEVGSRMLERLDYVKLAPKRILDAGSGSAREARALGRRYAGAEIVALDFALSTLTVPGFIDRVLGRSLLTVCADMEHLPFAAQSFQLVWSNMALHWVNEPLAVFREFERALSPEGLLMFSTLGPDTLKELRASAGEARVHRFIDMHDLGDLLVAAGFSAPVMDMELITIEYAKGARLLDDLRASGQTNARRDRARGLSGRRLLAQLRDLSPRATYEVVYGHAWKRPASDASVKTVRVFKSIS